MDPGHVKNENVQFNYDLELQPKSRETGASPVAKKSSGQQLKTKKTSVLSRGLNVVTRTDKLQMNQFNTS